MRAAVEQNYRTSEFCNEKECDVTQHMELKRGSYAYPILLFFVSFTFYMLQDLKVISILLFVDIFFKVYLYSYWHHLCLC